MTSSLVSINHRRELVDFEVHFSEGVQYTLNAALAKDNHYTLFRYEDWPAWVIFTSVFLVLITFDNVVLNRNPQHLTMSRAIIYTCFWVLCAGGFCGWVYYYYGVNQAFMWMSGYMLEWMLSFDNLFVFHVIFQVYATPDYLKHRPLYLGIVGAVFFRLIFIFIGEYLMHAMFFMHFIFGAFLIYTGFKTVMADDEDEDPSQHPAVKWIAKNLPFISAYDKNAAFFVRVPVDDAGQLKLPDGFECQLEQREPTENDPLVAENEKKSFSVIDFAAVKQAAPADSKFQLRATMLLLVVLTIEISDLLFAVDSVSAIVAQVNDLFLAYTSAVFAMLGLRATFFIIDVLVKLFTLLKYGVASVLVFVGIKLIVGKVYHIPPGVVCIVLVTSIAGSMVASVIQDEMQKKMEGRLKLEADGLEKTKREYA